MNNRPTVRKGVLKRVIRELFRRDKIKLAVCLVCVGYDDHVIAAIRSMGMEPIQWDVDSLDWKDYDADTICRRVTSKVQPGSIVLFHNAALHTPEALPAILDCLINDGYTVVPISQLILDPPYTIDHTGRQFPAETASTT